MFKNAVYSLFSIVFIIFTSCSDLKNSNNSNTTASINLTSNLSTITSSNVTAYSLYGNCSYIETIEIYLADTKLATTSCSSGLTEGVSGTWSVDIDATAIADGSKVLSLKNMSDSTELVRSTVVKDTAGPSLSMIDDGSEGSSIVSSPSISWTAALDTLSTIASYEIRILDSVNTVLSSWVNLGSVLTGSVTGLSLTVGQTYKAELRAIDAHGNTGTSVVSTGWQVFPNSWVQRAYVKAVNGSANDNFGAAVAISGNTLVVGVSNEDSNQVTITNGNTASSDNSAINSGAIYVYKKTGITWAQEAYIKAANAEAGDSFGRSVAISGDTIVVGASHEDSNQTTITNGNTASSDNSAINSGAVYVYKRTGTTWAQEAYIKASNANSNDLFGIAVAISTDTIAVSAPKEQSNQTTITNGVASSADNSADTSGAVYVYKRTGTTWAQEAYIKAANAEAGDEFGSSLGLSGDTIVVGTPFESSSQTTITNGTTASSDNSLILAGAVYVYKRTGTVWAQEAYIKSSNIEDFDSFGDSVAISNDTIAVGVPSESSNQNTITNGSATSSDNSASSSGAVYVYKRTGAVWAQEAYIKAPNVEADDFFGFSVALDGDILSVGAPGEDSNQSTITNGTSASVNNSKLSSGAAYTFRRTASTWAQEAYIKAANVDSSDAFGKNLAVSGSTVVIGSPLESSSQSTITTGETASSDNTLASAGAVYIYKK